MLILLGGSVLKGIAKAWSRTLITSSHPNFEPSDWLKSFLCPTCKTLPYSAARSAADPTTNTYSNLLSFKPDNELL